MSSPIKLRQHIECAKANPKRLKVFGLLLYTDRHASMKKMLRDEDYWQALDEASGERWVIFSARPARPDIPEIPGSLGMLTDIWEEPAENKELLSEFNIQSTQHLPLLIVFTELEDGALLQTQYRLRADTESAVFNELRVLVTQLTEACDRIDMRNRENVEAVFYAIAGNLERFKFRQFLSDTFNLYEWIKGKLP